MLVVFLRTFRRGMPPTVPFERIDKSFRGKDGVTRSYRQKMLLTETMKVVRHASMSKAGYDNAMDVLNELVGVCCNSLS
jgi:hypothetical protein